MYFVYTALFAFRLPIPLNIFFATNFQFMTVLGSAQVNLNLNWL